MQLVVALLLLPSVAAFRASGTPSGGRNARGAPLRTASDDSFWTKQLELQPGAQGSGLAGDVGFDPLGLAKTQDDLLKFRDAELKHARIAMLAASGWPLSELWDKPIANAEGLPTLLQDPMLEGYLPYGAVKTGLAPSVLNGGLAEVPVTFWAAVIVGTAAVEYKAREAKAAGAAPGDLGFDPLGFYKGDAASRRRLEEQELSHGRAAMLAITTFAAEEAVLKGPVVENTPVFFQPAGSIFTPAAAEQWNLAGFEAAASAFNDGFAVPFLELLNQLGFEEMANMIP